MPGDRKQHKPRRVDQNVMSDTSTGGGPGANKEDWIASHLRRVYDQALGEAIPQQMLDLLKQLDDSERDEDSDEGPEKNRGPNKDRRK